MSGVWLGAVLAACGGGGGPECAADADCPVGRYCGAGACTYDCVFDAECPQGQRCDAARGRCTAACQQTHGGVEACDALDNDCDGLTDEAFPRLGTTCRNAGCAAGAWVCSADGEREECDGPVPAQDDATCNGLDEDCDGATDEDALAQPCPLQLGVCAGASTACQDGGWLPCDYGLQYVADRDARCDQLDEDCDGATDEDATFVLQPEAGAQASDGLDNNCNGLVDEPGGVMVPILNYPNTWIDAYELTVFENPDCTGARYGQASNDYPATWPAGLDATTTLYACSLSGLVPSGYLSWYRALRACQAQGKRMCSREMFLRACSNGMSMYFPYGFNFAEGQCNDPVVGPLHATAAGSYPACSVGNGTFDMSGNLAEWVSDDSVSSPGQGVLASWSFDRRICFEGASCYTADPGYAGDLEYLIRLLDCNVENTVLGLDSYPRETVRLSFGARCCLDGP
ncbi:MAG TPA: MopE-related protein [Myxococcota bacterium]|nr:MopE-related protein [Myxococcota bacterium]HRY93490.1 MopE-related protein [Myxococcota bacterium]HSA20730.1 MopE-related protein [Myxococcota bacterium]